MLGWLALRWATKHTGKNVSEVAWMSPEQEGNHCNLCRKSFFAEISTEALRILSSKPNMWGQFFYRPYRWCAWQTEREREGCRLIASCQTASLPPFLPPETLIENDFICSADGGTNNVHSLLHDPRYGWLKWKSNTEVTDFNDMGRNRNWACGWTPATFNPGILQT